MVALYLSATSLHPRSPPNQTGSENHLNRFKNLLSISYSQKVFLLASIPLILAGAAIALVVNYQTRQLLEQELQVLETELLSAKQAEILNYMSLARTAIISVYGRALPNDAAAKLRVTQRLSSLIYGRDGYFFVYDYDGKNLVSPRQTDLINRNWSGLRDANGVAIVDKLISIARQGGGYHRYLWRKPSTGETAEMISYVVGLQDWRWAVGTGIFIDDVTKNLAVTRAQTEERIHATSLQIMAITIAALISVFLSGMILNIRERRLADAKLKKLTQRIFDTQEEERFRVARELHDGISQILVGVRYVLELAIRWRSKGDARADESILKARNDLNSAIVEVRRISHDLRPSVLDDLGLSPALRALTDEYAKRTGISVDFSTVVFSNRLDAESKTALYRVAQEALTNIERHSRASHVTLKVFTNRQGATMRIQDNGIGMALGQVEPTATAGLGLRNMQERIENLDGTLRITGSKNGTTVEAKLPLKHFLKAQVTLDKEPL
ncbi:MAG: cache domain-containing protein [Rhodobacteraceae bacterium]|nr:cache domain-containing protein [Paracoccaceae bacterium]